MSPEWITALGQSLGRFVALPELLTAALIFACIAFGIAWWLRGRIDRAHINRLESRIDRAAFQEKKYKAALRENEQLKHRVEALEQGNAKLRAQITQTKEALLSDDTNRVLVHMFKAAQAHDVGTIATALGMERSLLQYHLERLLQSGWAGLANLNYREGKKYWLLTPEGRRRVAEGKLVTDK
jgi:DNA-binding MarR family transcriptional regulator